jgi:putative cell wall-binding protein
MRLAKSSLHRWFDLRVSQARKTVLAESAQAREFAAAFASRDLEGANSAVVNALRDQVFNLIQSAGIGDKAQFAKGLKDLTLAMSRMQRVELQAKRVDVDQRKIKILEDRESHAREALDQTTKQAAKKGAGQFSIDDINLLRERTFGLPPLQVPAHD